MEQKGHTFYIHTSYVSKMGGEGEEEGGGGRVKVIIDTDPGIDDAFAVLASLSCMPELDVVALASTVRLYRYTIAQQ